MVYISTGPHAPNMERAGVGISAGLYQLFFVIMYKIQLSSTPIVVRHGTVQVIINNQQDLKAN